MGFFSGLSGLVNTVTGGLLGSSGSSGGSVASSQDNDVTNSNTININFDELAKVQEKQLNQNVKDSAFWQTFATESNDLSLTLEEEKQQKEDALKLVQLKQNQEALDQSKKNTKYTIYFALIGIFLTIWQFKYKGKK